MAGEENNNKPKETAEEIDGLLEEESETIEAQEEEAAMIAAFEGEEVDVSEAPPVDKEEESAEVEEPEIEKPAEVAADDPVVEPEPAPKTELEIQQEKYEARIRKLEGKYGELNAKVKQAEVEAEPAPKKLSEELADGKKFQEMNSDFPEYTETMQEQARTTDDYLQKKLDAIQADSDKKVAELQDSMISREHKNWKDTVNEASFTEWQTAQDEHVQSLCNSNNPNDVIEVLDRYKEFSDNSEAEAQEVTESRQRLEENIPATNSSTNRPQKVESAEDAFLSGFNN